VATAFRRHTPVANSDSQYDGSSTDVAHHPNISIHRYHVLEGIRMLTNLIPNPEPNAKLISLTSFLTFKCW